MKRRNLIVLLLATLGISACGIFKPVVPGPSEHEVIRYIDSTIYHDSTVYHHIYKERYNDYSSLLDTLELSTSYSDFRSWVDTTQNLLKGTAENKEDSVPVKIKWKEKVVYKDSIQIKEIPVPVEVVKEVTKYPKSYWWFMGFTIVGLLYIGMKIYLKFKRK